MMSVKTFRAFGVLVSCLVVVVLAGQIVAEPLVVTWDSTGPSGNFYKDSGNWDYNIVPINPPGPPPEYHAIIPEGFTVNYDILDPSSITELTLGSGSTLNIQAGDLSIVTAGLLGNVTVSASELEVGDVDSLGNLGVDDGVVGMGDTGSATIEGWIDADNDASVTAAHVELTSTVTRLFASNGSEITFLNDPEVEPIDYNTTGLRKNSSTTILSSVDPGSELSLPGFVSLDSGFSYLNEGTQYQLIEAKDGGLINLSGVQTMDSPVEWRDYLYIIAKGELSSIDLSSLQSIEQSGGYTKFYAFEGANISMPSLQTVNSVRFVVESGGSIGIDGNSPVAYNTTRLRKFGDLSILYSDGPGSALNLSAVTSLDAGFSYLNEGTQYQLITAKNGGSIDLSGLQVIYSPVEWRDYLYVSVCGTSSSMDLSSLQTIEQNGGYTKFYACDNAAMSIPGLQSARNARFVVENGGSISINGDHPVDYNTTRLRKFGNISILYSDGSGSTLNLSAVKSLDSGFSYLNNGTQYQSIKASNGGVIDLSGLETIVAPVEWRDYLYVSVAGAGSVVDISNLKTIIRKDSGYVRFAVTEGGLLNLGVLQGYNHDQFKYLTVNTQSMATAAGIYAESSSTITLEEGQLDVEGDLRLLSGSSLSADDLSQITVGGDFIFDGAVENITLELSDATLEFNGSGQQIMEVGGLGINANNGEFDVGEVVVGEAGSPTTVHLRDLFDNGNRIVAMEGLHVGELAIQAGSTLVLNDIPLFVGGVQVSLPDGIDSMSYGDGMIVRAIAGIEGDVNCDGVVDAKDINLMGMAVAGESAHASFQIAGNGVLGETDRAYLIEEILGIYYADFNMDGKVSLSDLDVFGKHYRYTSGQGWADGDCNGDGGVTLVDLDCLGEHWRMGMDVPVGEAEVMIPEPGVLWVLVAGGVFGMKRKRGCVDGV